jgi:copper(I)-binding protein
MKSLDMRSRLHGVTTRLLISGLLCVAIPAVGCLALPAATDIQVKDGWVRWLPGGIPEAGYFTLINSGTTPLVLIRVSSPDYSEISMHQSQEVDGMSRMTPVDSLDVKPNSTVRFAEGGYHLMLMRATRPIQPGDSVVITLHFDHGPKIQAKFEVRRGA